MELNNYFEDGANYQAQAVMILVKGRYDEILSDTYNSKSNTYDASIQVGRYENTREQGYIISIKKENAQRNFAVYEHRNSDEICVVVFDKLTLNTPTRDDVLKNMKDKYDVTKFFIFAGDCAGYIVSEMKKFIKEFSNNND